MLRGPDGTLMSYCECSDPGLLTAGLGEDYEIDRLCIKRYACHVTAQAPVQLVPAVRVVTGNRHRVPWLRMCC